MQRAKTNGTARGGTTRQIRHNTKTVFHDAVQGHVSTTQNAVPGIRLRCTTIQHNTRYSTAWYNMAYIYIYIYGGTKRLHTVKALPSRRSRSPLPGGSLPALLPFPRPPRLQAEGALGVRGAMDGAHPVSRHGALRSASLLVRGGGVAIAEHRSK